MSSVTIAGILLVAGAAYALYDIARTQERTIVVYTTPALRDALDNGIVPAFEERTGHRVAPVYVPAGQQFNRLRMSGEQPEADLLLHASPLYLEKGYAESRVEPIPLALVGELDASFRGREVEGGLVWAAFAWSPVVAVHPLGAPAPDLATTDAAFGFPHPLLSNNGVYVVVLLDALGEDVAERLLAQTRVQPTNARATIGGVADGSFSLTLGYEAVARFFEKQEARIGHSVPLVRGEEVSARVLFSAARIEGERHPGADDFLAFLFSPEAQALLRASDFRPVHANATAPEGALDLSRARVVEQDWTRWAELEERLPRYEIGSAYQVRP